MIAFTLQSFLPPVNSLMASARASMDSMSKLFVGSSYNRDKKPLVFLFLTSACKLKVKVLPDVFSELRCMFKVYCVLSRKCSEINLALP